MKFLIDECLSPALVAIARNRGFPQSTHVTWLGLRSRQDWALVRRAVRDGLVQVSQRVGQALGHFYGGVKQNEISREFAQGGTLDSFIQTKSTTANLGVPAS